MCILKQIQKFQRYKTLELGVGGKRLGALLADTELKRMIGLMYRKGLGKDQCMLFVFPYPAYHKIWMYNMRFRIDILWLDGDMNLVDYVENARPCASILNCRTYAPKKRSTYVVELEGGFVSRAKLGMGAKVRKYTKK